MIEILASVALVLSLVAFAGCAILLIKREDNANAEQQVRALSLEVADVVDRLQTWQRRDAARIRRSSGAPADELSGHEPVQQSLGLVPAGKDALRATEIGRAHV